MHTWLDDLYMEVQPRLRLVRGQLLPLAGTRFSLVAWAGSTQRPDQPTYATDRHCAGWA